MQNMQLKDWKSLVYILTAWPTYAPYQAKLEQSCFQNISTGLHILITLRFMLLCIKQTNLFKRNITATYNIYL